MIFLWVAAGGTLHGPILDDTCGASGGGVDGGRPGSRQSRDRTFPVLAGAGAHDVYPAADGTVWFTAQSAGKLGRLDPGTGKSDLIALGPGAAPHGVIVGPDGAAWVTEGGQNAIAGRCRNPRSEALPITRGAARGQPEHGEL